MTVGGTEASCAFNPSASQAQGTLASFATKKLSVPGVVTPGQGVCFVLRVELPSSASNAVQTDSATFGIDFRMDQAARSARSTSRGRSGVSRAALAASP